MQFKKYLSTEKSKKVDTQLVSFLSWTFEKGQCCTQRHKTTSSAELHSNICILCLVRGSQLTKTDSHLERLQLCTKPCQGKGSYNHTSP